MTKILVAIDATDESTHVLHTAQRLFGTDAEYVALTVVADPASSDTDGGRRADPAPLATPPIGAGAAIGLAASIHDDGGRAVDVAQERAAAIATDHIERAHAVHVVPMGRTGDAGQTIVAVADAHAADVIVMGSHERGWLRRVFTTSVPEQVVDDARCPVLLVNESPRP
jgi:nucleotide-binding universal stress UspA family protein